MSEVKREFCVLVVLSKVIASALLWKYPSFVGPVMERGLWRVEFSRVFWVSFPYGGGGFCCPCPECLPNFLHVLPRLSKPKVGT